MKFWVTVLMLAASMLLWSQTGLTEEEKAKFNENVIIPLPSEIIMALDNLTNVDWKNVVVYNYGSDYEGNVKIALNLGVKVADGFVAIQAKDKKNIGEMFSVSKDLAENFGSKSPILQKKEAVLKLVNEEKWNDLRATLDSLHNGVQVEMKKYHPDFVILASVGGWLEGLHVVTKALVQSYNPDASSILYQPKLIEYYIKELEKLTEENKNNPDVQLVIKNMAQIKSLCEVGSGNPVAKESVEKLSAISDELIGAIVKSSKAAADTAAAKDQTAKVEEKNSNVAGYIIGALILLAIVFIIIKRNKG